jgi:hypothetical protein
MWPTIKLKKRVEIHINSFNFDVITYNNSRNSKDFLWKNTYKNKIFR